MTADHVRAGADGGDMTTANAEHDGSGDLLCVLEHAERDLAGLPDELHVRSTRDALASVRTALDIVRDETA